MHRRLVMRDAPAPVTLTVIGLAAILTSCSSDSTRPDGVATGGVAGAGGSTVLAGGATGAGGASGAGGAATAAGASGSAGVIGLGGATSTGGLTGIGGFQAGATGAGGA